MSRVNILMLLITLTVFTTLVVNVVAATEVKYSIYGVGSTSFVHSVVNVGDKYIVVVGIAYINNMFRPIAILLNKSLHILYAGIIDLCGTPIRNVYVISNDMIRIACGRPVKLVDLKIQDNKIYTKAKAVETSYDCMYVYLNGKDVYVCDESVIVNETTSFDIVKILKDVFDIAKIFYISVVDVTKLDNDHVLATYHINYRDTSDVYYVKSILLKINVVNGDVTIYEIANEYVKPLLYVLNNTHAIVTISGKGIAIINLATGNAKYFTISNIKQLYVTSYMNRIIILNIPEGSNEIELITIEGNSIRRAIAIKFNTDVKVWSSVAIGRKITILNNLIILGIDIKNNISSVEVFEITKSLSEIVKNILVETIHIGLIRKILPFTIQLPVESYATGINIAVLSIDIDTVIQSPKFEIVEVPDKITVYANKSWSLSIKIKNVGHSDYAIIKLYINNELCDIEKTFINSNATKVINLTGCIISKIGNYTGIVYVMDIVDNVHDFKEIKIETTLPKAITIKLELWQIALIIAIIVAVIAILAFVMKQH